MQFLEYLILTLLMSYRVSTFCILNQDSPAAISNMIWMYPYNYFIFQIFLSQSRNNCWLFLLLYNRYYLGPMWIYLCLGMFRHGNIEVQRNTSNVQSRGSSVASASGSHRMNVWQTLARLKTCFGGRNENNVWQSHLNRK